MSGIDWTSSDTEILLNPRLSAADQQRYRAALYALALPGHIWMTTSGSTGQIKWAALSKQAILASAAAVNSHLESTHRDRWLNALPTFHVGGLGIWARSYLSQASVVTYSEKWEAKSFHSVISQQGITLTALVPTQIYDLVTHQLAAPKHLRAIIVGGGALNAHLYQQAVTLGWKLLPSYGSTECCSQVATAPLSVTLAFPKLKVLSHLQVMIDAQGLIHIRGDSLLTGYALFQEDGIHFKDPKHEGWLQTEDRGELEGNYLTILGRSTNFVKIGGESVDLTRLESIFDEIKLALNIKEDHVLIAMPDMRLGHVIHLASTGNLNVQSLIETFNQRVLPYERIRDRHLLTYIPRSPLGKLLRSELLDLLPSSQLHKEGCQ